MIQEADISHFYPNLGFRHSRGEGEQQHWLVSRSICPALATKLPCTAQPPWSWAGGVVGTGGPWELAPNSPSMAWPPSAAGRASASSRGEHPALIPPTSRQGGGT